MQTVDLAAPDAVADPLVIAGVTFRSRLFLGTGKYRTAEEMTEALERSGTEMVTVAIRRLDLDNPDQPNLLDQVDWSRYRILPNTAGCANADEALRVARLGRELTSSTWVKLEVIPEGRHLLPDPIGTLEAAARLIDEGFTVLPYISDDPVLARRLAELGCATVMPLASPIGSGRGVVNLDRIRIIVEEASVPVVVDAGLGVPSDAAMAMEMGADACLVNTAIAQAASPGLMAEGFRLGLEAGRRAHRAGRIPRRDEATASSPLTGRVS